MDSLKPGKANRLIHATSPYLLQHAYNPVDWHPWDQEALDLAQELDRPIFLSIGYAACHWCHVMEHECFENPEAARLLNDHFVPIKVDREERPDLDEIYMNATVLYTRGYGGWPMSVMLTPSMQPFFAGTYFPLLDMDGRPGFLTLLRRVIDSWRLQREDLTRDAVQITGLIREMTSVAKGDLILPATLAQAVARVVEAYDKRSGGLSSAGNKFPPSMSMELLLRHYLQTGQPPLLEAVTVTLENMARGGITDHLGGGICRYSTDPEWLLPHFEKMLYDQALVSSIFLDGYQATGRKLYAEAASAIFGYVLGDLRAPEGVFYSSEDADSEGLEGKFYLWTLEQQLEVLGEPDGRLFAECYDVTEKGNWDHPGDHHVPPGPKNILRLLQPLEVRARSRGMNLEELEGILSQCRQRLFEARSLRVRPGLDNKVLADWNGLMISSLVKGSLILEDPRYLEAAETAAGFILDNMMHEGRLLHCYGRGQARLAAYISDYAFLIDAFLSLFEATGARRWLDAACRFTELSLEFYWDTAEGGFFFTASDHEPLILRSKTAVDNAIPSGNSVMLMNLLKMALLLGRPDYREKALGIIQNFAEGIAQSPLAHDRLACGVEAWHRGFLEVLLVGDPRDPRAVELQRAVYRRYLPNKLVLRFDPASPEAAALAGRLPLLQGRDHVHDRPTAYVCRDKSCRLPVTDAQALTESLQ